MTKQRRKPKLSKRARRRKRQRIAKLSGLFVVWIIIIIGVSYALLYKSVSKVDKKVICDNVYIGQVNVSGMTAEQAKAAVEEKVEKYGELTLTMEVGEQSVNAAFQEIGLGIKDIDKLVDEAVSYGKKGTIWKRYFILRRLKKEKKVIDETFQIDSELAAQVMNERAVPLEARAVDASISRSGDSFEITDEAEGQTIDIEASAEKIVTYLKSRVEI